MHQDLGYNEINKPFVSVIIPVFNDLQRLKLCLDALGKQSYPRGRFEIILVDNGGNVGIEILIKSFNNIVLTQENKSSSYAARNKGIKLARGEILAFTDADCIPNYDWLEKGVDRLLSVDNCGLVGGSVKIFVRDNANPTAVEVYESVTTLNQEKNFSNRYSATANLFTYKTIMDRVGIFNDSLKSWGDLEWGRRVFLHGYKQVFAEEAIVRHPARSSFYDLYSKHTRLLGGGYIYMRKVKLKEEKFNFSISDRLFITWSRIINIFKDSKLNTAKKKVQFIIVYLFILITRFSEFIRLSVGGQPRR